MNDVGDAKSIVLGYLDEVWDQGRPDRAADYIADGYDLGALGRGPTASAANFRTFREAFPDLRLSVTDTICQGHRVAVWMRLSGTHDGPFRGHGPSGRHVAWDEVGFFTVRDGKIVDGRFLADMFGLRKALGVIDAAFG